MHDSDKDLQDLERLLGHAKPAYHALRHRGGLREDPAEIPRSRPVWHYAAAASISLAVAAVTVAALDTGGWFKATPAKPSRLAMSRPPAVPLTLRPAGRLKPHLSISRPRIAIKLRSPRRSTASRG